MLIVFPVGGLGNRMRVIDSTARYCDNSGVGCLVLWPYDAKMMACKWNDLFAPRKYVHNVNILYKLLIHLNKLRQQSRFVQSILNYLEHKHIVAICWINDWQKLIDITQSKSKYRFVIAETYTAFYQQETKPFQADLFRLTKELEERVDKETKDFDANTIGLHIRRTDNKESILYSPTELFKDIVRKGAKEGNRFYLCSDDETVKQEFLSEFGSQIILLPSEMGELNRNTTEGIKQATVELFALSRTAKIYGSYYSSFSSIASLIGGCGLETLTVKNA